MYLKYFFNALRLILLVNFGNSFRAFNSDANTKELLRAIPQPDPLGRDERKKERLASKKISQREI